MGGRRAGPTPTPILPHQKGGAIDLPQSALPLGEAWGEGSSLALVLPLTLALSRREKESNDVVSW
jgi:hypothetical protein